MKKTQFLPNITSFSPWCRFFLYKNESISKYLITFLLGNKIYWNITSIGKNVKENTLKFQEGKMERMLKNIIASVIDLSFRKM